MAESYIKDTTFEKEDYQKTLFLYNEFEHCRFSHCNLSEQDLSNVQFVDCEFSSCNVSMSKLYNATLSNVQFTDCKLLGLHFEDGNRFGLSFSFDHCQLDYASFYKLKIPRTVFRKSQCKEVDFTECDLNHAVFDDCNLLLARFDRSTLEWVDFRTSYNFSIDPQINKLKKARFPLSGIAGLLDKYDIIIE